MATRVVPSVESSTDLEQLRGVVVDLLYQQCQLVEFAYADEVLLHFGRMIPGARAERRGSWVLGTRGTDWCVLDAGHRVALKSDDPPRQLRRLPRYFQAAAVTGVRLIRRNRALLVTFHNG